MTEDVKNMREIKFRAWDNNLKEFRQNVQLWNSGEVSTGYGETEFEQGLILEMFTGLLDKSGKEIYEGDIISYDGNMTGAEGLLPGYILEGVKAIVSFKNGRFFPDRVDKSDEGLDNPKHYEWVLSQIFRGGHTKVIGNIHENPELMS